MFVVVAAVLQGWAPGSIVAAIVSPVGRHAVAGADFAVRCSQASLPIFSLPMSGSDPPSGSLVLTAGVAPADSVSAIFSLSMSGSDG
eukprot:2955605-Rhodomonas_salina.1